MGTKTKIRMIGISFKKGSVYTGLYLIPIPSLLHSLTHTPTLIEYRYNKRTVVVDSAKPVITNGNSTCQYIHVHETEH